MKVHQRLFLAQAKSDFVVFQMLRAQETLPSCHALHYLQMVTELLGKSSAWKSVPVDNKKSHKALVQFLQRLAKNEKAQKRLGFEGKNEHWANTLRRITPLAERVQKLAPSLAKDGPNTEYPCPPDSPTETPSEFNFPIWEELTNSPDGRSLLNLLTNLMEIAHEYL